jgi:N-acetyl-anhydromuramyl-L-alanine amidase AmpD
MKNAFYRAGALVAGAGLVAALAPTAMAASPPDRAVVSVDCGWAQQGTVRLQEAFTLSAGASGVPVSLLKAVSYMESRWDAHPGEASADGGYGPMNLTAQATEASNGKGVGPARTAESTQTARVAQRLTGLPLAAIKGEADANICAGAAVLASYQEGSSSDVNDWSGAVARYGTAGSPGSSASFAKQVYMTLREGQSRVTAEGAAVTLKARPNVAVPTVAPSASPTDCPRTLSCEWLPAPYEKDDPNAPDDTGSYGNHDIADRTGKGGPKLKYIVIHDTEATYDQSINLVQDPTYLGWNYTIRSSDGHVAQHMDAKDVGWHAGNWYVNMHSIGIEHEGKAGNPGWFTEAMYQNSASLVRYLGLEYQIPLDRAHVIGHGEVPGTVYGATRNVHWDPGPYWDWEHYFDLLKEPIGDQQPATTRLSAGDTVIVRPGYEGNGHTLTQCEEQSPGSGDCVADAPSNFAALRQAPSESAPLVSDPAVRPGTTEGSTVVSDVSARATAGDKLVVAEVRGDWVKVWWAGGPAWVHNPSDDPILVKRDAATVSVKAGAESAPVYGRAYPEPAAYPETIAYQPISPLEYTMKPGQSYAVTDLTPVTDYYRAWSFDGSIPGDRTDVVGQDRYYQIQLAHRMVFVRAADVELHR